MPQKEQICSVLIDAPVNKAFDYIYRYNEEMPSAKIGSRVKVRFNRKIKIGIVQGLLKKSHLKKSRLSPILSVLDEEAWFSRLSVDFLSDAAEGAFAGPGELIISALPKALKAKNRINKISPPFLEAQAGGEYEIVHNSLVGFREEYMERIKAHNGITFIIVESIDKAQSLANDIRDITGREVFVYSNALSYSAILSLSKGLNAGPCVVIGTRHLCLFPIVKDEMFIVENAWMDVYRQEVFPRYNARDVLKIRAQYGGGTYLIHEVSRNKEVEIMAVDSSVHKQFPAFIEEEIKADIAKGMSWAILGLGIGYAKSVVCQDCKRVMVCDACSRNLVLKKKKGNSFLVCKSCDKEQEWDFRCPYCGGIAIALKGWGMQRLFAFIKERLSGIPVFDMADGSNRAGVFLLEHWQNASGMFDKVLLLGIDAVLNLEMFFAKELAVGFMWSASNLAKERLYVHTSLTDITSADVLEKEYALKKKFGLPPYGEIVRLIFKAVSHGRAVKHAEKFCIELKQIGLQDVIYMPVYVPKQARKRRRHYAECMLLLRDDAKARDEIYRLCLKMRGNKSKVMIPENYREPLLSVG